jgi:hypothetical protein
MIYAMQYELRPAPHSADADEIGGAIATSFVRADDTEAALAIALAYYRDSDWDVVLQEQPPQAVDRAACEDDPEWLDAYDEAAREGECHLFDLWPIGIDDADNTTH